MKEDLAHGPSYDLEVVAADMRLDEEGELPDGGPIVPQRRIVNGCYDDVSHLEPDACNYLLQVITHVIMFFRDVKMTLSSSYNISGLVPVC